MKKTYNIKDIKSVEFLDDGYAETYIRKDSLNRYVKSVINEGTKTGQYCPCCGHEYDKSQYTVCPKCNSKFESYSEKEMKKLIMDIMNTGLLIRINYVDTFKVLVNEDEQEDS